jgi:hypothetical protein
VEPQIKLSKRRYIIVTEGKKEQSTQSRETGEWIYEFYQHFMLAKKHLKGSEHPRGWFDCGYDSGSVNIRWLYTDSNGFFAPELTFDARRMTSFKVVERLHKAFNDLPRYGEESGPSHLVERLGAATVEYVESAWPAYRPLRIPGESPLISLARAVS